MAKLRKVGEVHEVFSLYPNELGSWATRDEDCRTTVDWLAERGILVAPGDFYGPILRRGRNGAMQHRLPRAYPLSRSK